MWIYQQGSGKLKQDNNFVGTGYSGREAGLNDPLMQATPDIGPVPQGLYEISEPFDTETHGPYVMRLTPTGSTYTFGRSGFLIHGDSVENAGKHLASHGCIILPRAIRNLIGTSQDSQITVIA